MAKQVLIIEDNRALREMTRRRLVRFGYEPITTNDGESGLRLLQNNAKLPDIVLLDLSLPGKNGWTVAREIRSTVPHMPIIAITAHAMVGDREKALEAGCDEYLSKPLDFNRLRETMVALGCEP